MKNVVIGLLGTMLDMGKKRRWRPTVSLAQHPDFPLHRLELIYDPEFAWLAQLVQREIHDTSPETEVILHAIPQQNPWDFQEIYGKLFDFAQNYGFDEDRERYHIHLTTGTHVGQICWFLLAESRHIPARLIQSRPPAAQGGPARMDVIDLDLSRYNHLQRRFDLLARDYSDQLKGGIETRSPAYNALIDRIELVAGASDAPILLLGETGTGKTELAQRIHDLKLQRRRIKGRLVQVNCATLRGPNGLAALFGQRRSYTGQAGGERSGLLHEAHGGTLFLDQLDELGWDEQAALLHAIETGRYYPLGADHEVTSRFHVIAGTSRDPVALTAAGRFRPDLLARLNMWRFCLPPLRERVADMEPNLFHELARSERELGVKVGFNADALAAYLDFARDPGTLWPGNFRDFGASVRRLCTLAPRGRITRAMVADEIATLRAMWRGADGNDDQRLLVQVLGAGADQLDPFDAVQLAAVIRACQRSSTISEAGRHLFAVSRAARTSRNDADRLRKYLARFALSWADVTGRE
ncbi:RNA repair transcriptional activator RtcR family protein [Paracoccus sp. (in: a-proteobacteria)]|uniref:RNA repair transcriptional activator RtcR family protein n=1 Tax=Paracoccus sp. TaxID=267 RepID=UPI0026DF3D75|nr:RNA repair transcriptional activator RtcR family protein [Paracoccus sp. (in: a-proteobacteria)]MDO5648205.1 RNA repair transcriptional activator RtcR family protein [Paracoccus sp. (in: a-proteobacteria)]